MNPTETTHAHPAADISVVSLPDFLLMPLVEAAFAVIKKNEETEIPTSLRRISHFDSKALNNSTARGQIIQSLVNNPQFCELVEEEFFNRVEVDSAFSGWSPQRAQEIVAEAATRNDLPLLASMLWLKKPSQCDFALGLIVAYSSVAMMESESRDSQRAEVTRISHIEKSFEKEKARAELLQSDVKRLETELREERQARRVRELRQEAQVSQLQKQIDQHDEVMERSKENKERQQQRLEREASRAHELETRLRIAQEDVKAKSEKVAQLQEQLASALSSDMELTYEDLQNLIVAQKEAEAISQSILKIMNKTRSILSQAETPVAQAAPVEQKSEPRTRVAIPQGLSLESEASLKTVFAQKDLVVLVDGYNVSLNSFGDLSLELQRERTVACVTNVETRFHPSCVIVFDGQSASTRGRIQSKVHVVFSPAGTTADDVIIERIKVTPKDRPIVVVTSDRNLGARAKGLGCEVISSQAFVNVAG